MLVGEGARLDAERPAQTVIGSQVRNRLRKCFGAFGKHGTTATGNDLSQFRVGARTRNDRATACKHAGEFGRHDQISRIRALRQ